MVKPKQRKARLDKASSSSNGGGSEFIGFASFATTATAVPVSTTTAADAPSSKQRAAGNHAAGVVWSPVYANPDSTNSSDIFGSLFARLQKKRDAVTVAKGLAELQLAFSANDIPKRTQAAALAHWAWLYHTKFNGISSSPLVRASAVHVWVAAHERIPKVTKGLLGQYPELLGMLYATKSDPSSDVARVANTNNRLLEETTELDWHAGLLHYTSRILSYGRASVLNDALLPQRKTSSADDTNDSAKNTESEKKREQARDSMEERFERLVGNCLDALNMYLTAKYKDAIMAADEHQQPSGSSSSSGIRGAEISPEQAVLWYKTLSSPKPSLRRKTFLLLATVSSAIKAAPHNHNLLPPNLPSVLAQVLSSEKDAANVPILLETVLSLMVHTTRASSSAAASSEETTPIALAGTVVKPLVKMLKKACYGATGWTPTLLPLVAQFPETPTDQLALLQAALAGVPLVLGAADEWLLIGAVLESSSFVLLRPVVAAAASSNEQVQFLPETAALTQEIASVWCAALRVVLTKQQPYSSNKSSSGPAHTARQTVLQALGRQLAQLDQARPNCAFFRISAWFWDEGGLDLAASEPAMLTSILGELVAFMGNHSSSNTDRQQEGGTAAVAGAIAASAAPPLRFLPKLRVRLVEILKLYQESSGAIPPEDAYAFFQAAFDCYGPLALLGEPADEGKLEKFLMNDVLRWTIIHVSTLSTTRRTDDDDQRQPRGNSVVQTDFMLVSSCLDALPEKRSLLWESFFRELVAAKCDLSLVVAGLSTLVEKQQTSNNCDWSLSCDSLDLFAIRVGLADSEFVNDHFSAAVLLDNDVAADNDDEEESIGDSSVAILNVTYQTRLDFFRICLGLSAGSGDTPCLLRSVVLLQLFNNACSDSTQLKPPNPLLLEVFLQVAAIQQQKKKNLSLLSEDQIGGILLESWRNVDGFFERYSSHVLLSNLSLREALMPVALLKLQEDVTGFISNTPDGNDVAIRSWALRSWRLLGIRDVNSSLPLTLGIEHIDVWQEAPELLFRLSTSLFQHMDVTDRLSLVESWGKSDPEKLLVDILMSISEASGDTLVAARTKERNDRCAQFLSVIGGGRSMKQTLVERLVRVLVSGLSSELKKQESSERVFHRRVAVLSQLLALQFEPVIPFDTKRLVAEDVVEGDRLWYITDPERPEVLEEALVVKVHFDTQTGYYFAIQVDRDGKPVERQTIVGRLSREKTPTMEQGVLIASITEEEWKSRSTLRDLVLRELITPYGFGCAQFVGLGELLNILVSQIGIGKERGLGSPHYDLHRLVTSFETDAIGALDGPNDAASSSLWKTSLALGFGLNAPGSKWTMEQLRVNPIPLTTKLLDLYAIVKIGENAELDCAFLAWLTVSLETLLAYREEAGTVLVRSVTLLFLICSRVLVTDGQFTGHSLISCRAIYEAIALSTRRTFQQIEHDQVSLDRFFSARATCLFQLTHAFASTWESNSVAASQPNWIAFSSFPQIVDFMLKDVSLQKLLAEAAGAANIGDLSVALYDPAKRYYALVLLESYARRGQVVQDSEIEVLLAPETEHRLKTWMDGLEEEEAAEVEQDVYIVAEWVPVQIMNDIEGWDENGLEDVGEATVVGRLLTWLIFLGFIDTAAPKDFRNRPAFASYLGKCKAAGAILNLGVLHDQLIDDRKRKTSFNLVEMKDLVEDKSFLTVSQLASISLFRTVEVLPSLSRRWWEESCPSVFTGAVQAFVEKHVAPEILKRELGRIKSTTSFGPMRVSASLVSREVTALYVQDDFTLKVLISLPAAFPFRSAEVDCSKTLGVSQSRWKRWSLQITLMLNNQGGTLQDALMLWKGNVDKEFEGVEPCPVCYSVLHVKTHKLPSLECKTCHNRFHMDCLTQWFRSSGKSQCVICQQPWHGTRIQ